MTLQAHNRTVYCAAATTVWFGVGDDGAAFMCVTGWPRHTLDRVLALLYHAMKPSTVFAAAYGAKPSVDAVIEMATWAKWATTMWLLQFGCGPASASASASAPGPVSMLEFVAALAHAWTAAPVQLPAAPAAPAAPDAPATPAVLPPAPAVDTMELAAPPTAPAIVLEPLKGVEKKRKKKGDSSSSKKPRGEDGNPLCSALRASQMLQTPPGKPPGKPLV
jgi:hypothetical protein